jgi:hypothetical protein
MTQTQEKIKDKMRQFLSFRQKQDLNEYSRITSPLVGGERSALSFGRFTERVEG